MRDLRKRIDLINEISRPPSHSIIIPSAEISFIDFARTDSCPPLDPSTRPSPLTPLRSGLCVH